MKFFDDLAGAWSPGSSSRSRPTRSSPGAVDLDRFSSVVVADDALPGFVEPIATGPAQGPMAFSDVAAKTAATVPCAYQPGIQNTIPPTCAADFEFDVDGTFNNQSMSVALVRANAVDYDLYIERQSRISGAWSPAGQSRDRLGERDGDDRCGRFPATIARAWSTGRPGAPADVARRSRSRTSTSDRRPSRPSGRRPSATRGARSCARFAERGGNLVLTDGGAAEPRLHGRRRPRLRQRLQPSTPATSPSRATAAPRPTPIRWRRT